MSCEFEAFPHVYHTVSELRIVKDVRPLKNTYVKTLGYFNKDRFHDINWDATENLMDAENYIALDLTHLNVAVSSNKPYLISAIIFTVDFVPILTIKTIKKMKLDSKTLLSYHHQLLSIRKRTSYFENLKVVAYQSGWI